MRIKVEYKIYDPLTGKVDLESESHSWTKQAVQILCAMMKYANVSNVKDTGGTNRTVGAATSNFVADSPLATDTFGIIVGTGTGAESIDDYQLGTKIAHGSSSSQLWYNQGGYTEPIEYPSNTYSYIFNRMFTNISGGSITINEIAWYAKATATPYYFCVIRDLLGSGVSISNGASKIVQYKISITN